ncbi:MAG TPA: hypothetical protein VMV81_05530, partial [Phycisphaerae bacterium]|nr:hypothetical protein [Phycisphaerae bacterium]
MSPSRLVAILVWSLAHSLPPSSVENHAEDRVVKRFDFSEQARGNFESFPLGWRPIYGPGYPRFLEPRFDFEVGHSAAPSFKLPLGGGNVGAVYAAHDIPVNASCEYRVSAWIRTEGLIHGSAHLSAYYLDAALRKIPESERVSDSLRDDEQPGSRPSWRKVSFDLPAGFEKARWISLECLVDQSSQVSSVPRPIARHDMRGIAWFDDISVVRIPRISLRATAADQIFASEDPVACSAQVIDVDGRGIEARLDVLDADEHVLQSHRITAIRPGQPESITALNGLMPGFFTLRLTVNLGHDIEEERRLSIIRLGPNLTTDRRTGPGIGVELSDIRRWPTDTLVQLIQHLGVREVALHLWDHETSAEQILHGRPEYDRLLTRLSDAGIGVTAMLSEVPRDLRGGPQTPLSVFDVLSQPASRWRAYVTMLTSRYAERVSAWQLGDCLAEDPPRPAGVRTAVEAFRNEAKSVIGPARIVVAWPATLDLPARAVTSDDVNLGIPGSVPASRLGESLEHFSAGGMGTRATLAVPANRWTGRIAWLSEWARRLIVARAGGVQLAMVPQPWQVAESDGTLELEERFLIERAIAQTLDGMHSGGKVWLGEGLEAYVFMDDGGTGALAV